MRRTASTTGWRTSASAEVDVPAERSVRTSPSSVLGARDVEVRRSAPKSRITALGGRFARACEPLDRVADERRVRVEQRRLEPQHEQAGHPLVVGVAIDVAVGIRDTRHPAEDRHVRPARVVDDEQHHRDDAEHEAGKHVDA